MSPSEDSTRNLIYAIAKSLGEREPPARFSIRLIIETIGYSKTIELLKETMEVEKQGGMMTFDGKRRRTTGGVFFNLAKVKYWEKLPDNFWPSGKRPIAWPRPQLKTIESSVN